VVVSITQPIRERRSCPFSRGGVASVGVLLEAQFVVPAAGCGDDLVSLPWVE
jgi:hypothetical protein